MDTVRELKKKYRTVLPFLNEKQQRVLVAAEAEALGRGGISLVAEASGISRPTIYKGLSDQAENQPRPQEGRRSKDDMRNGSPVVQRTRIDPGTGHSRRSSIAVALDLQEHAKDR